jgi:hypothetical protein
LGQRRTGSRGASTPDGAAQPNRSPRHQYAGYNKYFIRDRHASGNRHSTSNSHDHENAKLDTDRRSSNADRYRNGNPNPNPNDDTLASAQQHAGAYADTYLNQSTNGKPSNSG